MEVRGLGSPIDIAVSGLRAQSLRLNVVAGNIANANTTRTDSGEPYRRREVVLQAGDDDVAGVRIIQIAADTTTQFKSAYLPGHPDANKEGYVQMPNVDVPVEMMEMITASRAYQANAAVLKRYQEMMDLTTELLR